MYIFDKRMVNLDKWFLLAQSMSKLKLLELNSPLFGNIFKFILLNDSMQETIVTMILLSNIYVYTFLIFYVKFNAEFADISHTLGWK